MIEEHKALVGDIGQEALGKSVILTTSHRVSMPCQCHILCGVDQDGVQAALVVPCDEEHEEVVDDAGQRFAFMGRMEGKMGVHRPQERIAEEAMRAAFSERWLPIS